MNINSETITLRPQRGAWVLFLLGPLLMVAFVLSMMQLEVKPIWWGTLLLIINFVLIGALFLNPCKFVFNSTNRTMEVHFWLRRCPTFYAFDELKSIYSCVTLGADGDANNELKLELTNGTCIVLITAYPVWGTFLSGCKDAAEIIEFRRKIATMTGISDLGFTPAV
jgi:hypothetical protein